MNWVVKEFEKWWKWKKKPLNACQETLIPYNNGECVGNVCIIDVNSIQLQAEALPLYRRVG